MHGGTGTVNLRQYFKTWSLQVLVKNSEMTRSCAAVIVSFFQNLRKPADIYSRVSRTCCDKMRISSLLVNEYSGW